MIDLTKAVLPEAIAIGERYYRIQTDFKYMLMFQRQLEQEAPIESYDFMFIDAVPPAFRLEALQALIAFMNPPKELPRKVGTDKNNSIVLDYAIDADLIYAAFIQQYGIDLITERLHWYQFCALLAGLKDTKLNDIIGFRMWEHTGGKMGEYEKTMKKLREAWEIRKDKKEDAALAAFEAQLTG